MADSKAKAANNNRCHAFRVNHEAFIRQFQEDGKLGQIPSELQEAATQLSKAHRDTSTPKTAEPVEDLWTFQRERLCMMRSDKHCSMPSWDQSLDTVGFLQHAPFAVVLWSWLCKQRWFHDSPGISRIELYIQLSRATGWLSPVNSSGIPVSKRPLALRSTTAKACWAHEADSS